jgi:uncharacterized protein (TIGR00299 family) protein
MKIAYFECSSGIAGDMCLAALVDAGVEIVHLQAELSRLGLDDEFRLHLGQVTHQGQVATKIDVEILGSQEHHHHHHHDEEVDSHEHHHHHDEVDKERLAAHYHHPQRNLPAIEEILQKANLSPRVTEWSLAIFRKLAVAEAEVHGIPPEKVHFHEVGAIDAIVDIVGTCIGLDYLGVEKIYCSELPIGGGNVRAAHGILPVPVPAVVKLWTSRQVPVYNNGIDRELVTPTGAAIVVTLADEFAKPTSLKLHRVGLGGGTLSLPIPNILRLWIGETNDSPVEGTDRDTVTVLSTQVDDLNPQAIGYLFDRLLAAGALDIFTQPIAMKKNRPGTLITAICSPKISAVCREIIFQETATLGIREEVQNRTILKRRIESVETPWGSVSIKIGLVKDREEERITNVRPEYEDCAHIARQFDIPWREVHLKALQIWEELNVK